MATRATWGVQLRILAFVGVLASATAGCEHMPIDHARGPAPLRIPRPDDGAETFEDSLTGGEVFSMYCAQCHNARALGERPFANYQNVAAHMRVRACFTGKEYEKLLAFLQRWHDLPQPPTPANEPSPKRLIFGQPMTELRDQIAPVQPGGGDQGSPAAAQPAAPPPAAAQPAAPPPAGSAVPQPAPAAQPQPEPSTGQPPLQSAPPTNR